MSEPGPRSPRGSASCGPCASTRAGVTGPTKGQAQGSGWRRTSEGLYVPADVDDTSWSSASSSRGRGSVEAPSRAGPRCGCSAAVTSTARPRRTHPVARIQVAANGDRLRSAPEVDVRRVAVDEEDVVIRYGVRCATPGARGVRRGPVGGARWWSGCVSIDMAAAAELTSPRRVRAFVAEPSRRARPDARDRGSPVGRRARGVTPGGAAAADLAPTLQLAAAPGQPHRGRPGRSTAGHSRSGVRRARDGRRVRRRGAPRARPAPSRRTSSRRLPARRPGDRDVRGGGPGRRGPRRRPAAGDARARRPATAEAGDWHHLARPSTSDSTSATA